jgi:hypothetical protein
MKKNILIILIASLIFGVSTFIFYYFSFEKEVSFESSNNNKIQDIDVKENNKNKPNPQIGVKPLSGKDSTFIKVSFRVLDNTYNTEIKENSSVFDLMNEIKKENSSFDFKYKEYPSLGVFIDEINGVKGGDGKYWIYYVNDIEASVGVSKYLIKSGDIISWKKK